VHTLDQGLVPVRVFYYVILDDCSLFCPSDLVAFPRSVRFSQELSYIQITVSQRKQGTLIEREHYTAGTPC
jgi:hypothetical protein